MNNKFYLSASKIETFEKCSALYAAKYIHEIPDAGNDGSNRGSVVHDVLELFLKKRHFHRFKEIDKQGSCKYCKPVWRLIVNFAKKYNVCDQENLDLINKFIMVALRNNFFGPKGTKEIIGEKEFNISVNSNGLRYNIRGYIDKTFIVESKNGLIIEIIDYKTSKTKFEEKKINNNTQALMYHLALRHLYPKIKDRKFDFLFLKFPFSPIQKAPKFHDEILDGFEWRLTELQDRMESFTLKNADDRLAVFDKSKSWLCGRGSWICPARNPLTYFLHETKNGEKKGYFTKEEIKREDGDKVEFKFYSGCNFYFDSAGKARNFN